MPFQVKVALDRMIKSYTAIRSIEHPERNRCVDIIRQRDGEYRFQEWRRDIEDTSGWILVFDSQPALFESEAAAIKAAKLKFVWLELQ